MASFGVVFKQTMWKIWEIWSPSTSGIVEVTLSPYLEKYSVCKEPCCFQDQEN